MKTKTSQSKSLLLIIIIINLSVMFVLVVVLAKSDHDHHHHHHHDDDHPHDHKLLNKAKKIYNGRRASREEAKFMAAILEPKAGTVNLFCSAVIITHDMLLTAAHCFDNFSHPQIRRMQVWPGAVQINSAYYRMNRDLIKTIQSYWIHPQHDSKLGAYDLAIIKVGPAPWRLGGDDRLTVAQMPVMIIRQWLPLKAYGYGFEDGNVFTGNLNYIQYTRIYGQAYCERMLGLRYNAPDILFATKEWSHHHHLHISSGQAWGDSGGGVFVHGTVRRFDQSTNSWIQIYTEILVGIASHIRIRNETMRQRKYFFHTNITTFLPWIQRFSNARFETYQIQSTSL